LLCVAVCWAQTRRLRRRSLQWVASLNLQISFAKEPYKRDNILQKRPRIFRSLLIVATPYVILCRRNCALSRAVSRVFPNEKTPVPARGATSSWRWCVCHGALVCVTWRIHACDMTHTWHIHDSYMSHCVTWKSCRRMAPRVLDVGVCDMARRYVRHDSSICVIRLVDMCDRSRYVCVIRLVHMCDMTHSYVWYDLFICVTWLIHMCDMTRSYVWLDSDGIRSRRLWARLHRHTATHCNTLQHTWHNDSFICVTWLRWCTKSTPLSSFAKKKTPVPAHGAAGTCWCVWLAVSQCVALCCSVLQCVAVCYSVLQCVAACGSANEMFPVRAHGAVGTCRWCVWCGSLICVTHVWR